MDVPCIRGKTEIREHQVNILWWCGHRSHGCRERTRGGKVSFMSFTHIPAPRDTPHHSLCPCLYHTAHEVCWSVSLVCFEGPEYFLLTAVTEDLEKCLTQRRYSGNWVKEWMTTESEEEWPGTGQGIEGTTFQVAETVCTKTQLLKHMCCWGVCSRRGQGEH